MKKPKSPKAKLKKGEQMIGAAVPKTMLNQKRLKKVATKKVAPKTTTKRTIKKKKNGKT